jgi:hypothetical protein
MTTDQRNQGDEPGRIVWLRRPGGSIGAPWHSRAPSSPRGVGDDGVVQPAQGEDDYRHRMIMNALAFIVCTFLIVAGIWLANKLAEMRKNQDCVLSGRRGCTPVDVEPKSRY